MKITVGQKWQFAQNNKEHYNLTIPPYSVVTFVGKRPFIIPAVV